MILAKMTKLYSMTQVSLILKFTQGHRFIYSKLVFVLSLFCNVVWSNPNMQMVEFVKDIMLTKSSTGLYIVN